MSKRTIAMVVVLALVAAGGWWWRGRGKGTTTSGTGQGVGSVGGAGVGAAGGGSSATRRARLEGRVHGPGDAAVPGAIVHVEPDDGEPTTIAAGADGRFALDGVEPGAYTVSAAAAGFVPAVEDAVTLRGGETTRVDLALAAGGVTVRGTVSDASGGPIAGASVTASLRNGFFGRVRGGAAALTDGDGRYALSLAPGSFGLTARHGEYVGASAQIEVRDTEVVQDFRLVPGGVIEGIVKDEVTGEPVAGASVEVERERGGGWAEGRAVVTVESDATGAFRAPGLMPGSLRLRAEVERDGRLTRDPVVVPLGVAEQAAGIEVFVGAAPYVAGRVTDETGAPVGDATVVAIGKTEMTAARTHADGSFRFVGLDAGTWTLDATSTRHQSGGTVPVTLAAAPVTGVEVKVASAPHITGRVEPAGVAQVAIDRDLSAGGLMMWGGGATAMASTQSAADGRFDLTPVESGKQTVIAKAADGRRGKLDVEVPAKGAVDVVIRLEERGSIAGRVVDQHGAPLFGTVVHVKRTEAGKRSTIVVNGVDLTTDRAAVARDGSFVMRGLDAGRYELTVADERGGRLSWARAAKGKERSPVVVRLAENEQKQGVELEVELDDGVIRGVVKNPDGTARADAWVTASLRHDELMPERPQGDGDGEGMSETSTSIMIIEDGSGVGGTPPVLTDESGRFEIRGLRRGGYDLVAEADRGALRGRVEGVRTGGEATIALAGLARIHGVVTAGGKPVTELTVEVEGIARRAQTVRDAAGRFRIDRIDPGTYTVRVRSEAGLGSTSVVAEAGKTAEVAIALAGPTKVRGRLVDGAGKPVADAPVLAMPVRGDDEHGQFSFEGPPPQSDADGRFELEVEAGDYQLLVLGGGPRPRTRTKFTAIAGQIVELGDVEVGEAAPPPPPSPSPPPPPP